MYETKLTNCQRFNARLNVCKSYRKWLSQGKPKSFR